MSDVHDPRAQLPPSTSFAELVTLAENLRWTWHIDARALFQGLFAEATPAELEWPLRLLVEAAPALVEARLAVAARARRPRTRGRGRPIGLPRRGTGDVVPDDARRRAVARGRLPRRRVRPHGLAAHLRRRVSGRSPASS